MFAIPERFVLYVKFREIGSGIGKCPGKGDLFTWMIVLTEMNIGRTVMEMFNPEGLWLQ
jgi:hypothetical protein